jgi:uncharacterized membrane protein YdjX (TVP38/TMEM64 family)
MKFKKIIPLLIIIAAIILAYALDLHKYLSYSVLKENHEILKAWAQSHLWLALFTVASIYIVIVALSLPVATSVTLFAGYLFGTALGGFVVIVNATIGACIIFLVVRYALADWVARRSQNWVQKLEKGFQANAFNYLLFLRLVPLFPFWVVNIVPALLNMHLRSYAAATFFGIIPGSFVYAALGNSLNTLLAEDKAPNFGIIYEPSVFVPLLLLGFLALAPVVYKRYRPL